jgi:hypothetical protein
MIHNFRYQKLIYIISNILLQLKLLSFGKIMFYVKDTNEG